MDGSNPVAPVYELWLGWNPGVTWGWWPGWLPWLPAWGWIRSRRKEATGSVGDEPVGAGRIYHAIEMQSGSQSALEKRPEMGTGGIRWDWWGRCHGYPMVV